MKSPWKWSSALAFAGALGLGYVGISGAQGGGGIPAEPIPSGFGFPTPEPVINTWVATNNVLAMRSHAWNLWAGMTAPSQTVYNGQVLPIWETWYSPTEVFPPGPLPADVLRIKPSRPFISPNQFHHLGAPGSAASQVVAFNKFDGASATFLEAGHSAPVGPPTIYQYTLKTSLDNLNLAWGPTPTDQRTIAPFPTEAVDTKPVFWLIKAQGLTPVPFWQGPAGSTAHCVRGGFPSTWDPGCHPTPTTWVTCVLVDPAGVGNLPRPTTPGDLAAMVPNPELACSNFPIVVPRTMFYSFEMDADEAMAFNNAQGSGAQPGDFAALVAMHVTTKEITNWTWQTYWWQAGMNPPNNFPGDVSGMVPAVQLPWRNYAMCTAYSVLTPGGQPVVCFNPFLETDPHIPDGINSNCMSCHGTARYPGLNDFPGTQNNYPPRYPYPVNPSDPIFNGQTRTDFVWAIPNNAQ